MRKALTVYQTYVEMMNDDIRKVGLNSSLDSNVLTLWVVLILARFSTLTSPHLSTLPVARSSTNTTPSSSAT